MRWNRLLGSSICARSSGRMQQTPALIAGLREPPLELAIMDADRATEYQPEDKLALDTDDGLKGSDWCYDRPAKEGRHFHRDPAQPGWALRETLGKTVPKSCRNCRVFLDACIAIEPGFRTKAECEIAGKDRVCKFFACPKKKSDRLLSAPSVTCFWNEHIYSTIVEDSGRLYFKPDFRVDRRTSNRSPSSGRTSEVPDPRSATVNGLTA